MRRKLLWRRSLLLTAGLCVARISAAATGVEYQVKAAFIYKFATYIRWPAGVDATTPFVIGILGKDPFGPALNDVVRSENVQGRAILVKTIGRVEDALHCDLVFVSTSERGNLQQILSVLRRAPILTVSDLDQFAEQGGMIGLVTTEDNHIRFNINKAVLEQQGLRASSQLLHLAHIVGEGQVDRGGH
ncbi:MAG: YfiR family protein [Thermoanaerobaculia bacterium]